MTAAKNVTDAMVKAAEAEMLALLNIKPRLTVHTRAILEAALAAPAGEPQAATKSAPSFASSLPQGESGPSVTTPTGGAGTARREQIARIIARHVDVDKSTFKAAGYVAGITGVAEAADEIALTLPALDRNSVIEECAKVAEDLYDEASRANSLYDGGSGSLGWEAACREIEDAILALPPAPDRNSVEHLRTAMREACDLLAERTHGNPARSPGHNARLKLEAALKSGEVK